MSARQEKQPSPVRTGPALLQRLLVGGVLAGLGCLAAVAALHWCHEKLVGAAERLGQRHAPRVERLAAMALCLNQCRQSEQQLVSAAGDPDPYAAVLPLWSAAAKKLGNLLAQEERDAASQAARREAQQWSQAAAQYSQLFRSATRRMAQRNTPDAAEIAASLTRCHAALRPLEEGLGTLLTELRAQREAAVADLHQADAAHAELVNAYGIVGLLVLAAAAITTFRLFARFKSLATAAALHAPAPS